MRYALLSLLALGLALPARAQTATPTATPTLTVTPGLCAECTPVPDFQVHTNTAGNQVYPAIDGDHTSGRFVIVWGVSSGDVSGDNEAIRGQIFDRSGTAVGSEFKADECNVSCTDRWPDVAVSADGDFVVVWTNTGPGALQGSIAQRYDSAGAKVGANFEVDPDTSGKSFVDSEDNGDFVVANVQGGSPNFMNFSRWTSTGVFIDGTDDFDADSGDQDLGDVAVDADGDFVIVWDKFPYDGDQDGIVAQRWNSSGVVTAPRFAVNTTTTGAQVHGRASVNRDGTFTLSWDGNNGVSSAGLWYRQLNNDGSFYGPEVTVRTGSGENIDASSDGINTLAVYTKGGSLSSADVFGRYFADDGTPSSAEYRINTYTTSGQLLPVVWPFEDGTFYVTWASNTQDGDASGIYAAGECIDCVTPTPTTTFRVIVPAQFVPNSPTITPTPSSTPTQGPPTSTPTPVCTQVRITGNVFDVGGTAAASRRLSINVPYEQVVDHCLIRVSARQVTTSASGALPAGATAIAGSTVVLALEGGNSITAEIPRPSSGGEVTYASIVGATTPFYPSSTLTNITVSDVGQFSLTSTKVGSKITLTRGGVRTFTLAENGDANGFLIRDVGVATSSGDFLVYGQSAGGALSGTWPSPSLANPVRSGVQPISISALSAGDCVFVNTFVDGMSSTERVVVTPSTLPASLAWSGFTPSGEGVGVARLCALSSVTPGTVTMNVYSIK